jgi:hypothetical protein
MTRTAYTANIEELLEWNRQNPVERKPLTPERQAWHFGAIYFDSNRAVPSRALASRLHPDYSEKEIDAYIEGARGAQR